MYKNADVWWCLDCVWGCLDGVWMVSGWCLDGVWIRSESVWGCINTKSVGNNITSWYSDIASYSGALYCIKRPLCGDVWIVSGGVWMGPECVWG